MNDVIRHQREFRKSIAREIAIFNEWFSFLAQDEAILGELKLIRAQLDQMNALLGIIDCRLVINVDKDDAGCIVWGPENGMRPIHEISANNSISGGEAPVCDSPRGLANSQHTQTADPPEAFHQENEE